MYRANRLTSRSTAKQAVFGLDELSVQEHKAFTEINKGHAPKLGFPTIIAIRVNHKASIVEGYQSGVLQYWVTELSKADRQVVPNSKLGLIKSFLA